MITLRRIAIAFAAAAAVATVVPVFALAAAPVIHEHAHFTSEPYGDVWCGIAGTSVDTVVAQYLERDSGASILTVDITTLFTATASGKSMLIRQTGARRTDAPVDNGDGTFTVVFTNTGQSPSFKLPQGPPIALDVGLVEGAATFDAEGEFLSFEVIRERGQRPGACDLIIAALS
jgi:hypothetical protein